MAELKDILNNKDYKQIALASGNIGNNPSRNEIESILTENGIELPVYDSTYFLIDTNNHNMQVTYIAQLDDYFYTGMSLAS